MSIKNAKPKKKVNKVKLWSVIVFVIATLGIICLICGIAAIAILLKGKPTISLDDFEQLESSVIYDMNGDEIANLGTVIRQNVEYNEIPNCVVDAFVSIEDSRFFEHNGFDVPRFSKAMIQNLMSLSFDQGGSTFTMQLIKNTYFTDDETGTEASRSGMSGIKRKVQEIALALDLNGKLSKQAVFESYVNKLNFGGDKNIRGIQKASQYYFGKDLGECGIVEGALLAGVINAPNYYNPFYNLDAAKERVGEVLYQMYHHGYLTKTEYQLAKSIRLEDLLKDPYAQQGDNEGIEFQAYIDQVVSEAISLTGIDPYTQTMHIYTYMNPDIQRTMDNIQAGNMDGVLEYPDDYFEVASVAIENSTGAVVGILGGRNYANGGQLLLNHATEQYKQPGSSIKPILDYCPALENLGWATDHVITDRPMFFDEVSKIIVINDSGTYEGDQTLKQALGKSINTCAIQALEAVIKEKGFEYIVNYCKSLGYNFNLDDFDIQYAMGGTSCEVTPLQHAGAYTAIFNGGLYNKPHTIKRIEFTNGKSPITPTYTPTQVMSDAAAYMTADLMKSNVDSYGGTYSYVKADYPVFGKTGTTDYGTTATSFGIPSGAIKDGWLVAATSEYTTATWVGYEKAVLNQPSYINKDYYFNQRPQGKIAHMILEATVEYGKQKPTNLTKPASVTSISHIIGTWPYAAIPDGVDDSFKTTGLIKKDAVKLVSLNAEPGIKNMDGDIKVSYESGVLTVKWPEYPDKSATEKSKEDRVKDISLKTSSGEVVVAATGTCLFDKSWLFGSVEYACDVRVNGAEPKTYTSKDNKTDIALHLNGGDRVEVTGYYKLNNSNHKSNTSTQKFDVKEEIKVPAEGSSRDEVYNWASRYTYVNYYEQEVDASSFSMYNTFKVTQNGSTVLPGSRIEIDNSNNSFDVVYYYKNAPVLKAVQTSTSEGTKVTFSVSNIYGGSVDYSHDYGSGESFVYNPDSEDAPSYVSVTATIYYLDGTNETIQENIYLD